MFTSFNGKDKTSKANYDNIEHLVDKLLFEKTDTSRKNKNSNKLRYPIFLTFYKKKFLKKIICLIITITLISVFFPLTSNYDVSASSADLVLDISSNKLHSDGCVFFNVSVPCVFNISCLKANVGDVVSLDFSLIDNSSDCDLWQGVLCDVELPGGVYDVEILGYNKGNLTYSDIVKWNVVSGFKGSSRCSNDSGGDSSGSDVIFDDVVWDNSSVDSGLSGQNGSGVDVVFDNESCFGNVSGVGYGNISEDLVFNESDVIFNGSDLDGVNSSANVTADENNKNISTPSDAFNDTLAPFSTLEDLDKYFYNQQDVPVNVICKNFSDGPNGSGIDAVLLYYRYSTDNTSWSNGCFFESVFCNCDEKVWHFTFPNGSGYYRLWSVAVDKEGNWENKSGSYDVRCRCTLDLPLEDNDSDDIRIDEPIINKDLVIPSFVEEKFARNENARVILRLGEDSFNKITSENIFENTDIVNRLSVVSDGIVAGVLDENSFENIKNIIDIEVMYKDEPFSVLLGESLPLVNYDKTFNDYGLTGENISIAILDTGVNSGFVDFSVGYDFVDDDGIPEDNKGHGTKVASVINSIAPDAELIVAKVLDDDGFGYESTVIEGLEWCLEQNPDIISFSIGTSSGCSGFCDSNILADICNQAYQDGVFVVAASGNDRISNIVGPACGSNVLSVGATDDYDAIADFSNVNPTLDMFAPGVNIETVAGVSSGTSMSAPHVAGAAALILEYENIDPAELKNRLKTTGKPIFYSYNDSLSIDIPRLDLYNAVINKQTMTPYNYSDWWQGKLDEHKYTTLGAVTFYFDDRDTDLGAEAWTTNPDNMIDGKTSTTADTSTNGDVQLLDGNTCNAEEAEQAYGEGTIEWVHMRAYGEYDGSCSSIGIILRPIDGGTTDGSNYDAEISSSAGWGNWIDITNDSFGGGEANTWTWDDIESLDCDVVAVLSGLCMGDPKVKCAKVEIEVGYNEEPESTINDIPESAGPSDVANITGGSTDEDGTVAGVYLRIVNTTDRTDWCGSSWGVCSGSSATCSYSLSANADSGNFNSNDEDWYYNTEDAGVTWVDGKSYTVYVKAKDNDGDCQTTATTDSFTYSPNAAPTASYLSGADSMQYAGKQYSFTTRHTDEDGADDINKAYGAIGDANNDIQFVCDPNSGSSPAVDVLYGSGYLIGSATASRSSTTNGWDITWTYTLDWDWDHDDSSDIDYFAYTEDDGGDNSGWDTSNQNADYENELIVKEVSFILSDSAYSEDGDTDLTEGEWFRGGVDVTASGTICYEGATGVYPPGTDACDVDLYADGEDSGEGDTNLGSGTGAFETTAFTTPDTSGKDSDYDFDVILSNFKSGSSEGSGGASGINSQRDNEKPSSSLDAISPYERTFSDILINSSDPSDNSGSGVKQVTLWYRWSNDNSSWGSWTEDVTDSAASWQWSFNFTDADGAGYYEFYCIAMDNVGNEEDAPPSDDAMCQYIADISINVTPGVYDFGTVSIGSNNYSTSGPYFTLTNNGNVNIDVMIKGDNATNQGSGAEWKLSNTQSHDNFSMKYKKDGDPSWFFINTSYDSFCSGLSSSSSKSFDLNLFMATTSSTVDPLEFDITIKSVAS